MYKDQEVVYERAYCAFVSVAALYAWWGELEVDVIGPKFVREGL